MAGKCVFNNKWLSNSVYEDWIRPCIDKNQARCNLCGKSFIISKMGESALKSHMKSKKHCDLLKIKKSSEFDGYLVKKGTKTSIASTSTPCVAATSQSVVSSSASCIASTSYNLKKLVSRNDVLDAEILWAFKTISCHLSYKSNENIEKIFQIMFPDSSIAAKFTCGEKKTAYISVFGISCYLKDSLLRLVNSKNNYVLLFDESLNKMCQRKQMDIHIRYWEHDIVKTSFLTSIFLGHGKSEDLLAAFHDAITSLSLAKVIQVSMDGPFVNLKFLSMLQEEMFQSCKQQLLNVGTCPLHTIHNSLKVGSEASHWDIEEFCTSAYFLFKDSPARREDFVKITKSSVFPKKFVKHRWLENVPVCEALLEILPDLAKYISAVKKKQVNAPQCKSFLIVQNNVDDNLLTVKLEIFLSISKILHSFLLYYQTEKPMIFFMAKHLGDVLHTLLRKFIKSDVLSQEKSLNKIVKLDINDVKNHLSLEKIDLGFCGERKLKSLIKSNSITDSQAITLRRQAKLFLLTVAKYVKEKSPIQLSLVRNLSCFDPTSMNNDSSSLLKFKTLLRLLVDNGQVKEKDCETIILQYDDYLSSVVKAQLSEFIEFDVKNCRIDSFFYRTMHNEKFSQLWKVVEKLLILSHGQASVERGFSVNKNIEVENMKEMSYVSQRLMCQYISNIGGVTNLKITNELRKYVSSARMKYSLYLDEFQRQKADANKRRLLDDEGSNITAFQVKQKTLEIEIQSLIETADTFALKAEDKCDFTYISKSNSLRKTANDKKAEVLDIDKQLAKSKENI